jgi:peptidyl-prolyl cis-trans isomerase A (cyclophilin A)
VIFRAAVSLIAMALTMAPLSAHAEDDPSKGKLRNPAAASERAPGIYKAKFDTSKGVFMVEVHRDWAPVGADRFYNLVKIGFYDGVRFFRVVPGFMVQFGINGTPTVQAAWRDQRIKDDPVRSSSNKRGYVTFAHAGPDSRTTQVFINFQDNSGLDSQGFPPFGVVIDGLEVVDKINSQYREQPSQTKIQDEGNIYLNREFPKLDFVKKATVVP